MTRTGGGDEELRATVACPVGARSAEHIPAQLLGQPAGEPPAGPASFDDEQPVDVRRSHGPVAALVVARTHKTVRVGLDTSRIA